MKRYIGGIVVILISLLAVSTYTLYNRNQALKEEISISMSNQKAFVAENSSLPVVMVDRKQQVVIYGKDNLMKNSNLIGKD